jgi:hypothetical protein
MTKENTNKQAKMVQQEIKVTDNIAGAEYSNMMQVVHNKEEVNLLFAHILPPTGKMVAKITTSPGHFKRMIEVMERALKSYEEQFGKIDTAREPKSGNEKIGF